MWHVAVVDGVVMVVMSVLAIAALLAFDQVMSRMFSNHRAEWVEAGGPSAIFFRPDGSTWTRNHLWMSLLFSTPEWARRSADTLSALLTWRRLAVAFYALALLYVGASTTFR